MREYCCENMAYAVKESDVAVCYNEKFREYGIRVLDGGSAQIEIYFCPWCGEKLPVGLRDEWFAALDSLGIDDPEDERVPEAMKSDIWWKKTL